MRSHPCGKTESTAGRQRWRCRDSDCRLAPVLPPFAASAVQAAASRCRLPPLSLAYVPWTAHRNVTACRQPYKRKQRGRKNPGGLMFCSVAIQFQIAIRRI